MMHRETKEAFDELKRHHRSATRLTHTMPSLSERLAYYKANRGCSKLNLDPTVVAYDSDAESWWGWTYFVA